MKFFEKAGTFIAMICLSGAVMAKGHDYVAIEGPSFDGSFYSGCTVLENKATYFAVDCESVQPLGNTIFTGTATKEESVFVFLPNTFNYFPYVCFQVGLDKYKGGNVYLIECLQESG